MKTMKSMLALASVVGLLAGVTGCATNDQGRGGMANDRQSGSTYGSSDQNSNTQGAEAPPAPTGPNGSVGRGNPFGVGAGSGLTPAR